MLTVAISFLKPQMLAQLDDLGKQVEKVNRWIDRCADDTQKRRLSAGAKRDLDARFHILAGHVGDVQAAAGDATRWTQWAAGMWAGLTFLEDCRNTCPAYFRGPSLAQPAQDADHAVQCARKGRPADSRDRDAGVRAGRVGRENGTGTADDQTGRFRHEHWRGEGAGNPTVPWHPACEPSVGQRTQNLALVTARRYDGDRHITC